VIQKRNSIKNLILTLSENMPCVLLAIDASAIHNSYFLELMLLAPSDDLPPF
jgi:hypothetical protein